MGRILIAEDEVQILEVMKDILEGVGHFVVGVKDGEEALRVLKLGDFDLALVDVMMPKMDGYHLAAQIHGLENPPEIVIVTSRNFDGDRQTLHAAGVTAYLPKPFVKKDLIDVVSTVLSKRNLK